MQSCCIAWLKRISNLITEDIITVDGKTFCGSRHVNDCKKALHIINTWSCANQICLGQLKVEDKSNEILAVPELLKLLYIKGAIVTLDAMGAQEETVKQICEADADYVITLKGNQGALHETVKDSLMLHDKGGEVIKVYRADAEVIAEHGRIEERFIEVMSTEKLKDLIDSRWVELKSIARITYTRIEPATDEIIIDKRHLISSLRPDNPTQILRDAHTHWQVENTLH